MRWHPWNESTLAEAEERGLPLLLVLGAAWCPRSRALIDALDADDEAGRLAAECFLAVRADKDRQPELDARYRGAGWPTAALLHPRGGLLAELPVHPPSALVAALLAAAQHGLDAAALRDVARVARRPEDETLDLERVDRVVDLLLESADPVHGGWGTRHKFPHPEALHLLTVRWSQTGDPRTLDVVLRTLRSMQEGAIHDRVEGGFYRFASGADWSKPHPEKPLASNAKRLLAYVEAYQALGEAGFRDTARGIREWMVGALLDAETGAFFGAQVADAEYANLTSREARARHGAPRVDRRIQTDLNSAAIIALLKASVVIDDDEARVIALGALDFLLENLWDRTEGAAHFWDGAWNQPGYLRDQAALLRALVEAVHYAGANRYLGPAEALARTTIEALGAADGSFRESRFVAERRPAEREDHDLVENAVMAEALVRLGHLVRDEALVARGRETLAAFAGDHLRHGFAAAAYGRAVDLLVHPPVHVTVIGATGDPAALALRRAALRPYVASRLVQSIDPVGEAALLERVGLRCDRPGVAPRAFIAQGDRSYAETADPERVAALMSRTERSA